VVEQGTHEALLASGGLYASLWNVQTGARARGA
jgi:ABC-type transport system involved in Fe-S cluster assembly fused permease/ATPase subunit